MWLLLLLLSRFSRVRLCAALCAAAHQAPHPSINLPSRAYWYTEEGEKPGDTAFHSTQKNYRATEKIYSQFLIHQLGILKLEKKKKNFKKKIK